MKRFDPTPQIDLFAPYVSDLPLRDQREMMERPFFSLGKRKRTRPIEYVSPDGGTFVRVTANPEFGMATIWDADILIWAASTVQQMRSRGVNDIPRTLTFQPYDLLTTIHRHTGGAEYRSLREALARLQATTIVTNIRARRGKTHRQFSWIESWTDDVDETRQLSRGMSLTLAEWFHEGVLMDGGLLAIDPAYFAITGGRERWLYRVARKHAGGAGAAGFAISFSTLFHKSGAEGAFRRFKFELLRIARDDAMPDFALRIENEGAADPLLRMTRRDAAGFSRPPLPPPRMEQPVRQAQLGEDTIARIRRDFPGWDVYALKAEFDTWLCDRGAPPPENYQAAFYGFVRRHHERHAA
ncbi:MAG: replication initiator protein A [bacterium]